MGRIRYRGIVALSAHVDGLRISLLGGIIPCHANLLIPWERLAPSADHGRGIELKSCSDEVGRNAAHGKLWIEFSGAEARRLRDLGLLR